MERIDIERLTIRYRGVEAHRARESIAGLRGELIKKLSEPDVSTAAPSDAPGSAHENTVPSGERTVSALSRRTADAIARQVRDAQRARR